MGPPSVRWATLREKGKLPVKAPNPQPSETPQTRSAATFGLQDQA